MSFRPVTSLCLALAALPLAACNQLEPIEEETGGSNVGGIPPAVRAAFEASCGKSGCHAPGATLPTLAGTELDAILTGTSSSGVPFVTIGDTAQSYIAIVMMSPEVAAMAGVDPPTLRMPLDRNAADMAQAADLNTILAWIGGAEFPGGGGDATTGGEETTGDATGSTGGGGMEPTFANVQQIFNTACSCHLSPPNMALNGNLTLADGMAYDALVDVKSPTSTLDLVEPGSPEMSYLYLKVAGGFDTAPGGGGMLMPLGGMLSEDQLALIEAWIAAGAPND